MRYPRPKRSPRRHHGPHGFAFASTTWNHRALGYVSASDSRDATDVIKHGSNEGVLGSLATSIANSMLKPDPEYPAAPHLYETLGKAFDSVGAFLKPEKQA